MDRIERLLAQKHMSREPGPDSSLILGPSVGDWVPGQLQSSLYFLLLSHAAGDLEGLPGSISLRLGMFSLSPYSHCFVFLNLCFPAYSSA